MSNLMISLFCVAATGYLISAFLSFANLQKVRIVAGLVMAVGFFAQVLGLGLIAYEFERMPIATSYELLEAIVCVSVLFFIVSTLFFRMKIGAFLVLFFAGILAVLPIFCPKFFEGVSVGQSSGLLPAIHASLAVLSYAFLAFAAALGGVYIFSRRLIKKKSNSVLARGNLSLEKIARLGKSTLFFATLLMFVSLLVGGVAAVGMEISSFVILKFLSGGIIFALMFILTILDKKLTDLSSARFCVLLFIISILLLIPIQIRTML